MRYSHELGVQWHFFGLPPWGPREGSKGQILLNLNYKVDFKDFYTKLCACSNKYRYKTHQTEFSLCGLGHAPGVGHGGAGVKKLSCGFAMAPHRLRIQVLFYIDTAYLMMFTIFKFHKDNYLGNLMLAAHNKTYPVFHINFSCSTLYHKHQ